ncbi:MAG TPA: sulfate adenylyltransferase subunit CysD [Dokdonella sp.]|nr:sulfate adenylyltransferase subunit CysD [Dokdonella sp.]
MKVLPAHLAALESEAIEILRDGVAEARNPVILFSGGKDSTVLAHLALRAFHPARPPMPLLHIDSTWEFADVLAFRDAFAGRHRFRLIVHANEEGRSRAINPFDHGDLHTTLMRTEPLKQALATGGYDIVFGGARRDEEASRAKERIVSVRSAQQGWEPREQRPEFGRCYNWRLSAGQTIRAFPLSNWTERDLWTYILLRDIELAPLYVASERRVVIRDGLRIVVDDPSRMRWREGEQASLECVRFRTLGCWPVTAAVPSRAFTLADVLAETFAAGTSERFGRIGDGSSLERQKREGYF